MKRLIRKLFLTKEIKSKSGAIHFQRYRLLSTPWFRIYIHKICRSDADLHMHDHPWHFASLLLRGSYNERSTRAPNWDTVSDVDFKAGQLIRHDRTDAHKITLRTPHVWTLVFAWGKDHPWGYQTEKGWMENQQYRAWKRSGYK